MESRQDQPFRLMDLPVEIRLLIYEFLPIERTHIHVQPGTDNERHELVEYGEKEEEDVEEDKNEHDADGEIAVLPTWHGPGTLTVTFHNSSFEILRVCRTIRHEARTTMESKANEIRAMTPRAYQADPDINFPGSMLRIIIALASRWSQVLEQTQHMTLHAWIQQGAEGLNIQLAIISRMMRLFVEQAGRQMLYRKQKLEVPKSVHRIRGQQPIVASYFVFQLRCTRHTAHPASINARIKPISERVLGAPKSKVVAIGRRNKRDREYAIVWLHRVEDDQASRVRSLELNNEDYYRHLGLAQHWFAVGGTSSQQALPSFSHDELMALLRN